MKFPTQHIFVANGKNGYTLHRDGNTTWKTNASPEPFDTVVHASVSKAKAVLGNITSASKH